MKQREFAKRPALGQSKDNEPSEEASIEQTEQNPVAPVNVRPEVTPNNILQLQRTIGNQAVQRLLAVQRASLDPTVVARAKKLAKKKKTKFKVELQDRGPKGGYRLKIFGRPEKFSTTTLKDLKARYPKLHSKTGTGLLKPKKYSRNHIMPWQTLAKEPRTATRGMSLAQLENYLVKNIDLNSFALKTYRNKFAKAIGGKSPTATALQQAFKFLLLDRYNNSKNLYINEGATNASSLNSSGGSQMKAARNKLRKLFAANDQGAEHAENLKKFIKNSLDFPSTMSKQEKLAYVKRFVTAWGANQGKYIANTTNLTDQDYEDILDEIES